ncbi:MAG: chain-length determining protein [Proteobacteria bacterium]|nr:chain-length determining protein [Pseudomonadota bacterium]
MRDTLAQILAHARGAWRYRWPAVLVAWVVAVAAWAGITLMPPVYEARAKVYVDTDSVLKPLLNGLAVNADTENRVNMMARMVMGRPNLERVARETDLSAHARTQTEFAEVVNSLARRVTLESGNGAGPGAAAATNVYGITGNNVYTLRFTDPNPVTAQRVVQHLLNAFVEDTLGVKRIDSDKAQEFLGQQIRDYESRLRAAEQRLAQFKQRNVGLIPGQLTGDYFTRLQTEQDKLDQLRAKYRLATQARAEIAKQLEGEEPTFGLFSGGGDDSSNDPQIAEYKTQLNQLLLQYTDKHPKVIALKATIAQLQAQKAAAHKGRAAFALPKSNAEASAIALDINPVYQNLRVEQSRTDVALAELRQQLGEQEGVVADLKSKVNTMPQTEAELTQLTRDYEVTKAQHTALVQRLDSARLSQEAEATNNPVKFRIIEPPVVPLVPVAPNRPLLMTAALLGALAAGVGLALLLNLLKPIFVSRSMLAAVTGLPVLGSVSLVRPAGNLREPMRLGLACAALVVVYVIGLLIADPVSSVLHRLVG